MSKTPRTLRICFCASAHLHTLTPQLDVANSVACCVEVSGEEREKNSLSAPAIPASTQRQRRLGDRGGTRRCPDTCNGAADDCAAAAILSDAYQTTASRPQPGEKRWEALPHVCIIT
jgi:hypothetical protein